jgi:uncharacterized protein (TIGR02611 family)
MATEEAAARPGQQDKPELLIKLQERKERHKLRSRLHRAGIVVLGFLIVLAGIVMTGPGVPGPGIATIAIGLGFLALEFDWAERWLERVIVWGDRAIERAENAPRWQKIASTVAVAVALAALGVAAVLWDIPLVPVL